MNPKCLLKRKATSDIADIAAQELRDDVSPLAERSPGPVTMQDDVLSHALNRPQHGAHSLARLGRGSNEDCFVSSPLPAPGTPAAAATLPPMHLLAVFDGHSSASVSTMAAEQLPELMTQLLLQEAAAGEGGGADLDDAVMQRVLQAAFEQLDVRVLPLDNSGSTATVAVLTPQRVHLAWVGDSRGVLLGQGGNVLGFTQEHRATREDEQERVAAAGGTVLNNSGLRVMGILQCTRAIGDKDLQPYGVIPMPDVLSIPRTGQEEFLVLATDGLWDVLSNQEVYDYAHKTLKKVEERYARQPSSSGICSGCQAAGIAARALAQCARKQRGSRDDITVMLVNLSANCSCVKPPVTLSSATINSGLLASSSTGGVSNARPGPAVSSGTQLHSSPASLGDQPLGSSDAGTSSQQRQQELLHKQLKQPPQPSLPPVLPAAQRPQHRQPPPQKWRAGSTHPGLLLQPSVCPGTACSMQASAFDAGPHHGADGLHSSLLSDLALSSPFAMMLGGTVAEVEVEVEVEVDPFDSSAGSGSAVVSGGSAPPAFVTALVPSGSAAMRKRSLSMALGNSRSCGSVGAPQLGPMGSSEPPVVVLT